LAEAITPYRWRTAIALGLLAAFLAVAVTARPSIAVAFTALVIVTLLAFTMPVTHLTILLALTTILPYSIENRYSGGGGAGSAGLVASDLFLLTGLLRVGFILPGMRLDRRRLIVVGLVLLFVVFTLFALVQGMRAGRPISDVGVEFRALAGGFATALIAMVALEDRGAQRRIMRGLLVLGLALGIWGVAQWVFQIGFGTDFGVRSGVGLTSGGRGQIQGGLFAFPVAVIIATAALASGRLRGRDRTLVLAALGLNAVSLLLTFERTFWVATVVGVVLVALRSGRVRRARALTWIAMTFTAGLLVLSGVAPGTLKTAEQRLFSIGQYHVDDSVRYRTVESGFVLDKVREKPLLGSGLADTIHWGQPWTQTRPADQTYSHVGYLWMLWRVGVLGAAVILALLFLCALWPGRAAAGGLAPAIRVGCQASLIALLIVNITFPAFQGGQSTYMFGFLVAYCAIPVVARARARAPSYALSGPAPDRGAHHRPALAQ
jgi:O-antigen ligase